MPFPWKPHCTVFRPRYFSSQGGQHGLGPIHTGRDAQCKQMGPVDVNGGVHTARKQHQRKNIWICTHIASRVLCGLGLTVPSSSLPWTDHPTPIKNLLLHGWPRGLDADKRPSFLCFWIVAFVRVGSGDVWGSETTEQILKWKSEDQHLNSEQKGEQGSSSFEPICRLSQFSFHPHWATKEKTPGTGYLLLFTCTPGAWPLSVSFWRRQNLTRTLMWLTTRRRYPYARFLWESGHGDLVLRYFSLKIGLLLGLCCVWSTGHFSVTRSTTSQYQTRRCMRDTKSNVFISDLRFVLEKQDR